MSNYLRPGACFMPEMSLWKESSPRQIMKHHSWKLSATAFATTLFATGAALADPAPDAGPNASEKPDLRVDQNAAILAPGRERRTEELKERKVAPELQKRNEQGLRRLMNELGFGDATVQDPVVAYMQDEARSRQPLREQGVRLYKALRSPDVSNEEVSRLLNEFRSTAQSDKERHAASMTDLDQKIGYTGNPRLEAMLVLFGVTGDYPLVLPVAGARIGEGARSSRRLQREKEDLARQIASLKLAQESLKSEKDNVLRQRDDLRRERDSLRRETGSLRRENEALQRDRDLLKRENEGLKRDSENRKKQAKRETGKPRQS